MNIGIQLYTLREFTNTADDFARTLAKCRAIGYEGVQLSAIACMDGDSPSVDASKARRMLDADGLACAATHRPWDRLRDHTEEEIELHRTLGCDYVAIGSAPAWAYEEGPEGFQSLLNEIEPVCDQLSTAGIRLGYHNHAIEFQRYGDRHLFDKLVESKLFLELDTYWASHAGVDLLSLIEKLEGRLPIVHLKDKAVFGWEVDYAPVGEGNLPWLAILPALKNAGAEWLLVEQDTCRRDPFDCIQASFEFLQRARPALIT